MNAASEWASAHPETMALVVWPVLTALVTFLFKPRTAEDYAKLPPRVAGVLRLVGALGLDVPNVLNAVRAIASAPPPPPPRGPSVYDDLTPTKPNPVPTVRPIRRTDDELLAEHVGHDTWPPPPFAATWFPICLVGGVIFGAAVLTGCASASTQAKRAAVTGGHAEELKECRDEGQESGSYAVYQRCADEVDRKYGIRKDGGQ